MNVDCWRCVRRLQDGARGAQQKLTEQQRSQLPDSLMRSLAAALAQHPFSSHVRGRTPI
jgi:hypothetical protein